jgi:hypothetical protein
MDIKVTPDEKAFRRFRSALGDLQRISGKDFETVIRSEMSAVLSATVRATPKASVQKIKGRHQSAQFTKRDGKTYKLSHRYPDALWSEIRARRERSLKRKLDARGLAASAWVAVADKLRLPIKAAGYIRKAKGRKGGAAQFVTVNESKSGNAYGIGFVQAMTKMNATLGLGRVFRVALNARANYFSRAVKLEATKKIKRVLDRYPGMGSVS